MIYDIPFTKTLYQGLYITFLGDKYLFESSASQRAQLCSSVGCLLYQAKKQEAKDFVIKRNDLFRDLYQYKHKGRIRFQ